MFPFLGSIYFNDCDLERMIPIFLIGFGVGILCHIFNHFLASMCALRKKEDGTDRQREQAGFRCFAAIVKFFLLVWLSLGSYYIYDDWSIWNDAGKPSCSADMLSTDCCESLVMYTAFTVMIFLASLGVACTIVLVGLLFCLIYLSYVAN